MQACVQTYTRTHTRTENYTPYIGRKGVTRQDKGKERQRKGKGRGEQILFLLPRASPWKKI